MAGNAIVGRLTALAGNAALPVRRLYDLASECPHEPIALSHDLDAIYREFASLAGACRREAIGLRRGGVLARREYLRPPRRPRARALAARLAAQEE